MSRVQFPFLCPRCCKWVEGYVYESKRFPNRNYVTSCPNCNLEIPTEIKPDFETVEKGIQFERWLQFKDKYCTFEKPLAYVLTDEGFEILKKQWVHLMLECWNSEKGYAVTYHTRFFKEIEPNLDFLFRYYVLLGNWNEIEDIKPENVKKVYVAKDRREVEFILRGLFEE